VKVEAEFYAQLRDLVGKSHLSVDLPQNATVTDLLEKIYELEPVLRSQDKNILIGTGVNFVDRRYLLSDGDAIAIMPPVQGG